MHSSALFFNLACSWIASKQPARIEANFHSLLFQETFSPHSLTPSSSSFRINRNTFYTIDRSIDAVNVTHSIFNTQPYHSPSSTLLPTFIYNHTRSRYQIYTPINPSTSQTWELHGTWQAHPLHNQTNGCRTWRDSDPRVTEDVWRHPFPRSRNSRSATRGYSQTADPVEGFVHVAVPLEYCRAKY